MKISIRKAEKTDMKAVLSLIQELAVFENAPNEVFVTEEQLIADAFGEQQFFQCLVAENETNQIIGMTVYYTGYSTWKGKTLYLEDLIVTQTHRKQGVGQLLFDALIQIAKETKVRRMDWQVLDWNEPAINFYKKNQALLDPEWINGRLFFKP